MSETKYQAPEKSSLTAAVEKFVPRAEIHTGASNPEKVKMIIFALVSAVVGGGTTFYIQNSRQQAAILSEAPDTVCPVISADPRMHHLENYIVRTSFLTWFAKNPHNVKEYLMPEETRRGFKRSMISYCNLQSSFPEITPDNFELQPAELNSISAMTRDAKINAFHIDSKNKKIYFVIDTNTREVIIKNNKIAVASSTPTNSPLPDSEFGNMPLSELCDILRPSLMERGVGVGPTFQCRHDDTAPQCKARRDKEESEENAKNARRKAEQARRGRAASYAKSKGVCGL